MVKIAANEYVEEQGTVLEPDIYPVTLTGFGEMEGQYGPRLVWQFVIEHEGEDVEAAGFTSYSMADGKKVSNLIKWARAMNGGEIPEDTDDLIGMPCRVDITNYTKPSGITKNKASDVRPPKKGQKAKAVDKPAAPPAATPGSDFVAVPIDEEDFNDIPF